MNKKEFDSFVIGTVLGDSSLCGKVNKYLFMGHCESQIEYLKWKEKIIRDNLPVGTNFKLAISMTSPSGKRQPFYKVFTTSHHRLTSIYKITYNRENKKVITKEAIEKLTPLGIAVLFMDDGCKETSWNRNKTFRKIRSFSFSFGKFSFEEVKIFQNKLLKSYEIESKIYESDKKCIKLKITTDENRIKFVQLIEPYVLDCMIYKIKIQE